MKKKVLIFLQAVFFYFLFIWVGYAITGRIERQHSILSADTVLVVAEKKYSLQVLSEKYAPIINTKYNTPKPTSLKYEVTEKDKEIIITYHAEWEDEKHPNILQDISWRIFRFSYFGFTTHDSEYIQINIDKENGNLTKAVFDSPVESGFTLWAHDRRVTSILEYTESNSYSLTKIGEKEGGNIQLINNKLNLEVGNWNHLFNLSKTQKVKNAIDFELAYLEDEEYRWYKYARRHHGEIFTPKSPANTPIIFFVSIIFITYLVIILKDYALSPKKGTEKIEKA